MDWESMINRDIIWKKKSIIFALAEAESGAKYYFKNSIKPDKETILYCALRAADIIDDDEMWKEIYKYGLSQKIKPRDELTREYREKTR